MPARSMAALTTVVASWVLGTSLSPPPNVPMAVRAVLTTKMSLVLMMAFPLIYQKQERMVRSWQWLKTFLA
ncbi:hypothetical protein COAQ111491_22140 [Comamonas aquatilis]